jgi:hypothetical protein
MCNVQHDRPLLATLTGIAHSVTVEANWLGIGYNVTGLGLFISISKPGSRREYSNRE